MNEPNLIERLEQAIACLDEIEDDLNDLNLTDFNKLARIAYSHGNAFGIVGEILTMVDGR